MLCVAAFSAQQLGDAAAGSKDVARAHPTPSWKQRNRTAHAITCNSTDRAQRKLQKEKSAQRANLRPRVSTKSEKRNRSHCSLPGSSKTPDENEVDWSPNVVCKRRTVNVTATVATQTLVSPLDNISQVSHTAMRRLQGEAGLSDMQMRQIARFMRKETGCGLIIELLFERTMLIYSNRLSVR